VDLHAPLCNLATALFGGDTRTQLPLLHPMRYSTSLAAGTKVMSQLPASRKLPDRTLLPGPRLLYTLTMPC
jgi:hypothetical protein